MLGKGSKHIEQRILTRVTVDHERRNLAWCKCPTNVKLYLFLILYVVKRALIHVEGVIKIAFVQVLVAPLNVPLTNAHQ